MSTITAAGPEKHNGTVVSNILNHPQHNRQWECEEANNKLMERRRRRWRWERNEQEEEVAQAREQ